MRLGGLVALLAAIGIASGCRYQNMNSMGSISAAPYTNLECFEPGNDEGFSFEVPGCSCQAGIRLRYVSRYTPEGQMDIHYEYESGFLNDSLVDIRMVSESTDKVDQVYVDGNPLPPYDQCTPTQREMWDLGIDSFTTIWTNYDPLLAGMFTTCTEDRIEEAEQQALER